MASAPGPGQEIEVLSGEWHETFFGEKIVKKSTIINNYNQGSTGLEECIPKDAFQLSTGIIVYESSPISLESRIYRAKLLSKLVGDRDIAVKLLPFGKREEREAKIHFSVPHHKNIVERILADTFKYRGQSTIYIAMERCDDQNMYDFVTSQEKNSVAFDSDLYLSYAKQVATGVAFLHSQKIVNRDLKPSNLLFAENKTVVKIADFGMCKEIRPGQDDATRTNGSCGTIGWSAPEILNDSKRIGLESDIYLLGLVFYFLWSYGKHPFGEDPHSWDHYIKHNKNLNLNGILIHDCTSGEEIIRSMLQRDPQTRPNAKQVLHSSVFENDKKRVYGKSAAYDDIMNENSSERIKDTGCSNYFTTEEWYVGKMSRFKAEDLLMDERNKVGTFLVRESETNLGEFVLSLIAPSHDILERKIVHYRVHQDSKGRYGLGVFFPSMRELIEHYKHNDGLVCRLQESYKKNLDTSTGESKLTELLKVDRSSVTFGTVISTSARAKVWKGNWNNKEVAIKVLLEEEKSSGERLKEIELMKNLRHKNILPLHAVVSTEPTYILTELMPMGNLLEYLKNRKAEIDTEDHTKMAIEITSGMNYMETMKYVHLDLRAVNVLVAEGNTYKITGFGLSRRLSEKIIPKEKCVVKWTAPEVLRGRMFSTKSDVWSFGVLLYEIVTYGELPYPDTPDQEVFDKLLIDYRMPKTDGCPKIFYDAMLKCWEFAPAMRPSFYSLRGEFQHMLKPLKKTKL